MSKSRKGDHGREPGSFKTLPTAVLKSHAYLGLSANARSLLLELVLQCNYDDNGRLLLSRAYFAKEGRGWASHDMLIKGKRELLAAGLIFETVKGQRPNKASWYAVTWRRLDKIAGYDIGVTASFELGAYRKAQPVKTEKREPCPSHGTEKPPIGPSHGTEKRPPVPPHGPIMAISSPLPVPPHGHPLDMPSVGARPAIRMGLVLT